MNENKSANTEMLDVIVSDLFNRTENCYVGEIDDYFRRFKKIKGISKETKNKIFFEVGCLLQNDLSIDEAINKALIAFSHTDIDYLPVLKNSGQMHFNIKEYEKAKRYFAAINDVEGIMNSEFELAKSKLYVHNVLDAIPTIIKENMADKIENLAEYFINLTEGIVSNYVEWNAYTRMHEKNTTSSHPIESTLTGLELYKYLGKTPPLGPLLSATGLLSPQNKSDLSELVFEGDIIYDQILLDNSWKKMVGDNLQRHYENLAYIAKNLSYDAIACHYPGTISIDKIAADKVIRIYAEIKDEDGLVAFASKCMSSSKTCAKDPAIELIEISMDALNAAGRSESANCLKESIAYLRGFRD